MSLKAQPEPRRNERMRAVVLTIATLLLALALLGAVAWQYRLDPFSETYVADALSYHRWAARLAQDGLAAEPVFHQSPLFPVLLSWVHRLAPGDDPPAAAGLLQIVLSSLAVALLVPLGRYYFGSASAGVAAALLALAFGPLVFYALKLFPVPLALATQGAALVALGAARQTASAWRTILAGLALGTACLARAEILLFVPVAAAAVAWPVDRGADPAPRRRLLAAALFLGFVAVAIAPATAHNLRRGDFVLIASSSGENLFIGNQVEGHGGYTALHPRAADIFSQRDLARLKAEETAGRSLKPSEVSAYWRGRTLDEIRDRPGAWLALLARKLGRLLHPGDPTDVYSFALERFRYLGALYLLPVTSWCLFVLGGVGCVLAFRGDPGRVWPLAAWALVHVLVLLVFFVDSRLRIPLLYALAPFGGVSVVACARSWRLGRHRPAIAALALLALLSVIAGNLLTRWTPRDVVRLASVLSLQGRLDDSLAVLAPEVSSADPDPYVLDQAGWVLQKKGEFAAASERYEQALATGLGRARERQTRTRLALVYEKLGRIDDATAEHERAVANETANAGTFMERGLFRLRRGERDAAIEDLRTAARLDPGWAEPREALRRLGANRP